MSRKGDGRQPKGDGAMELPLLRLPSEHPCVDCAACCRYVAVEIDEPTTPKDYDQIHWYVAHQDVSVYVDWEGEWYVEFKTLCNHLTERATCDAYRERPELCSDFSWENCEKTTGEAGHRLLFNDPKEFFDWFEAKRPKSFKRYLKYRRAILEKRDREARGSGGRQAAARPRARRAGAQSSTSI
jgi:Fe-S-cluster containining protein